MELKAYLTILQRRWWVVILALIVFTGIGYYASRLIKPVYQAETSLRVATPTGGTLSNIQYADSHANRLMNTYSEIASSDSVMQELKQKLNLKSLPEIDITIIPNSEIIQITTKANNPQLAANVANTLAQIVTTKSLTTPSTEDASTQDLSILQNRISTVEQELTKAKQDYEQLIEPYSKVTADIAILNQTISSKEQTYQSLQGRYQQAVISESTEPNPLLKSKWTETKDIISQDIQKVESELADIRKQYQSLTMQSSELSERLSAARDTMSSKEQVLNNLISQYDSARLGQAMLSSPQEITVTDIAVPPTRTSGLNPSMVVVLGGLIGILVGTFLAFLIDSFDTRIYSSGPIEKITQHHPIAQIPTLSGTQRKERFGQDLIVQKAFWPLCARIIAQKKQTALKTILITSPDQKDGKSTSIYFLAGYLGQYKQKVLVIDGDMRVPTQHKLFNLPNNIGLSSILSSNVLIEDIFEVGYTRDYDDEQILKEAIHHNVKPNVDVLTSGPMPDNLTDLLRPSILKPILETVTSSYDIILIDSPCLLAVTDPSSLAQNVDGVILAVRYGHTTTEALEISQRLMAEANANVIGVITTWAPVNSHHSYYRYYSDKPNQAGLLKASKRLTKFFTRKNTKAKEESSLFVNKY